LKDFIRIEQVSYSFGKQEVLRNVDLSLEKEGAYALIGKSGSGKSTLLNLIAGFLQPDSGTIRVKGEVITGPRRETAFLFQELGLFPWQTVEEAVAMPLRLMGQQKEISDRVSRLLEHMRLDQYTNKYPSELSGGERQRVALARTLISEPELLLMDEPTSALDAMTKEELQGLILKEQQRSRSTLLFVTHDIEEAMLLGQFILVLGEDKQVIKLKNPYYLVDNPREQLGFYEECIKLRQLLKID
jgi:ABC-type nitrate/sulfonate/bicarbonate transport system ATPase subunit